MPEPEQPPTPTGSDQPSSTPAESLSALARDATPPSATGAEPPYSSVTTEMILEEALPRYTSRAYLQAGFRVLSLFIGLTGAVMGMLVVFVDQVNSAAGGIGIACCGMACVVDGFVIENLLHWRSPRISLAAVGGLDFTMSAAALTGAILIPLKAPVPRSATDPQAWPIVVCAALMGISSLVHILFVWWSWLDRKIANEKRDEIYADLREGIERRARTESQQMTEMQQMQTTTTTTTLTQTPSP